VANFVYQKHIDFWQKRGLTRQEADQHAAAMFMGLAFTAEQRGGSPAEAVVELAKDHFGWKPKAAAEPLPPDDSKGVDLNKAKEKIARIKKGQALQGLGGTKNSQRDPMENVAGLTDEDLAALSDDEYVVLKQDKTAGRILNKRLEELG
jgi:hypothetical protein